jgi:hypothetical protein
MNASTILVAIRVLLGAMLLSLGCLWSLSAAAQQQDDYAAMLGYLAAVGRIDGQAFSGSGGAVRINQAAGDLNLQSNLQGMAVGQQALVQIKVWQRHAGDSATAPLRATVAIADGAFTDANGLYSINQVAGSGNAQFNAVAATLARLGIQEADDAAMATDAAMPAGGAPSPLGQSGALRKAEVSASAMHGFRGVLQLNQIAGSGNETGNRLEISVHGGP